MGDLSSRRGQIQGMDDMAGGGKVIKAEVPLSEMFGYSTSLRSRDPGPRDLHDGIQALLGGAEERRRVDHQPKSGSGLTEERPWPRANSSVTSPT